MKKIFTIVSIAFAACALAACSEDAPLPQNMQLLGAGQQQPEQQAAVLTKNLVECPASGYKYINAFTLADALTPPKSLLAQSAVLTSAQGVTQNVNIQVKQHDVRLAQEIKPPQAEYSGTPDIAQQETQFLKPAEGIKYNVDLPAKGAQTPNALSVAISGEAFKVTMGSGSVDCNTGFESQSSTVLNSQSPVIAFGTKTGLSLAAITELACPPFVTYSDAGPVKFVLAAASVDLTTKFEQASPPEGLNLNITPKVETVAGSINAPPPGVKAEAAQNPTSDYIYFLTAANWIGRIKPNMAAAGCVEFIDHWAPTAEDPAADSLKVEDKAMVIETPTKLININLTSGVRSEAAK